MWCIRWAAKSVVTKGTAPGCVVNEGQIWAAIVESAKDNDDTHTIRDAKFSKLEAALPHWFYNKDEQDSTVVRAVLKEKIITHRTTHKITYRSNISFVAEAGTFSEVEIMFAQGLMSKALLLKANQQVQSVLPFPRFPRLLNYT